MDESVEFTYVAASKVNLHLERTSVERFRRPLLLWVRQLF